MPVHEEIYQVVTGDGRRRPRLPRPAPGPARPRVGPGLKIIAFPGHAGRRWTLARWRSLARILELIETLEAVQRRVLWLAVRMVDHANRERPPGEIKVGGHQASSASMVGIMTALWFGHLGGADKVAVKPHASPVYHAIKYLTGELDRSYLTRLRDLGGLQSYPSRTKDPDVFDFSTGSVGLGVVAPLFAAATRRYLDAHFGASSGPAARFIALAGDAELDEGNVWEAITDPALQGLGDVMWVVDTNRQSLDRVVPDQKIKKLMEFFDGAGWHVVGAKYGRLLTAAFERPGGDALRRHIDEMSNEEYQSLFAHRGADLRKRFLAAADDAVRRFLDDVPDDELAPLVQNLGGHDLGLLLDSYRACDAVTDRPSVVFAYTVKGWGLPIAGDPLNHAALLTAAQIDELRAETRADAGDRVGPLPRRLAGGPDVRGDRRGAEQRRRAATAGAADPRRGRRAGRRADVDAGGVRPHPDPPRRRRPAWPSGSSRRHPTSACRRTSAVGSTSSACSPRRRRADFLGEERLLRWRQSPAGRHIELGISEMNLFLLLHALGLGHDLHGEHLLPIGTVYDPFVCRGLDALIYGLYSGARFVVVGTPAGITLAPEGGAHQSTITPSIGLELPGLTYAEPAYARALDWLLCDGLAGLGRPDGGSLYLRLSTRPLDQAPFRARRRSASAPTALRADVLAGGYRLARAGRTGRRRAGRVRRGRCPRCSRPPTRSPPRACPRSSST